VIYGVLGTGEGGPENRKAAGEGKDGVPKCDGQGTEPPTSFHVFRTNEGI